MNCIFSLKIYIKVTVDETVVYSFNIVMKVIVVFVKMNKM